VTLVPEVRAAGAEVVLVVTHEPRPKLELLAESLPVHVDALFAGHSHERTFGFHDGVPVVISGAGWRAYSSSR